MKRLYRKQQLPISLVQAWEFFSNPKNLSDITPPWLKFHIRTEVPDTMYPGLIIQYRITVPPKAHIRLCHFRRNVVGMLLNQETGNCRRPCAESFVCLLEHHNIGIKFDNHREYPSGVAA